MQPKKPACHLNDCTIMAGGGRREAGGGRREAGGGRREAGGGRREFLDFFGSTVRSARATGFLIDNESVPGVHPGVGRTPGDIKSDKGCSGEYNPKTLQPLPPLRGTPCQIDGMALSISRNGLCKFTEIHEGRSRGLLSRHLRTVGTSDGLLARAVGCAEAASQRILILGLRFSLTKPS